MSPRTKSVVFLSGAVVLGMILGGLITGAVVDRRLDRIEQLRTSRGLAFMLEEVVRPRDAEQASAFRDIIDSAAPRYASIFDDTGERLRALNDSVMAAVRPLLDDEQSERLEKFLRLRRDGRFRRGPERRGGDPERRRRSRPPGGDRDSARGT